MRRRVATVVLTVCAVTMLGSSCSIFVSSGDHPRKHAGGGSDCPASQQGPDGKCDPEPEPREPAPTATTATKARAASLAAASRRPHAARASASGFSAVQRSESAAPVPEPDPAAQVPAIAPLGIVITAISLLSVGASAVRRRNDTV